MLNKNEEGIKYFRGFANKADGLETGLGVVTGLMLLLSQYPEATSQLSPAAPHLVAEATRLLRDTFVPIAVGLAGTKRV